MASDKHLLFSAIFTSFLCIISACHDNDLYVIKCGAYHALVLDGSDTTISRLQYFTNSSAQLWKFQRAKSVGYFHIINAKSGKALDIHPSQNLMALVQKNKKTTKRQQWSLRRADGRIINREINRSVNIYGEIFAPGTNVVLWENNAANAQNFVVEALVDVDFEKMKARTI